MGFTKAPLPWPWSKLRHPQKQLLITSAMVEMVKKESVKVIANAVGVGVRWVFRARRLLGVPRFNAGTCHLWNTIARPDATGLVRGMSDDDISAIIEMAERGERTKVIAERFGITPHCVRRFKKYHPIDTLKTVERRREKEFRNGVFACLDRARESIPLGTSDAEWWHQMEEAARDYGRRSNLIIDPFAVVGMWLESLSEDQ
jgi:hypothetical protein